jgi:L-iditol 2-dehydrogenase
VRIPNGYILGHEFAGEIVALGAGVTNRWVGQRVAVDPAVPCEQCDYCHTGRPNLCEKLVFVGHPPHQGALREYMTHPAHATEPIPESISAEEGALLEPLGVGLHAIEMAKLQFGETVAVQGCGCIGLMIIQLAKLAGVRRLVALDVLPYRLELAARLGATETVLVKDGQLPPITPVHVVMEATGSAEAMTQSVDLVRAGGRIIYVGIPDGDVVSFRAATGRRKELNVQLSRRMKYTYDRAIELTVSKQIDLQSMITHRFPLDQTARAFEVFSDRIDNSIKVVVIPSAAND